MRFFNGETGELLLGPDARLYAHMPAEALFRARAALGGAPDGMPSTLDGPVSFPVFSVPDGKLSCVCFLRDGKLSAVECQAADAGRHKRRTADRQRAFLFECLGVSDPYPDSLRSVSLRCPFGAALVATDPRCGEANLRVTYR
jgi:hypothetical protein